MNIGRSSNVDFQPATFNNTIAVTANLDVVLVYINYFKKDDMNDDIIS